MKTNLFKLANQFEAKLDAEFKTGNATTNASITEDNKKVKKIAKLELSLNKKIAKHQANFTKYARDLSVKIANSKILPAKFSVCPDCQGQGRIAKNSKPTNIKVASATDYFRYYMTSQCSTCKGKRVIKTADSAKCSSEDLKLYQEYQLEKQAKNKEKKFLKKQKKAEKAIKKALDLKLRAENPAEYDQLDKKLKADKKAKKAEKKAKKAKDKADKAACKV